ncbi:MAG: periplasmic heavy metal sensor [Thermodesulfobacteriota bacterium]
MMRSKLSFLISFLFIILLVSPSFSQPSGMRFRPGMEGKKWRGDGPCWRAWDLNLSIDQANKLELIQQIYHNETQVLRTELISKRLELRDSLTNPAVKIESIRSKYLAINELQSKLEEKAMEYLVKVRNLLTQEQLKSWCPEQEFPFFRGMMHGPGPLGPLHPKRPPLPEGPEED